MSCGCGNVPCRHIVITNNNNCGEDPITVTQSTIGTVEIKAVGPRGFSGTPGTSGTSGISGTPGTSGTSGTSGISGTPGTSGTSGTSGIGADPGNIYTNVYLTPIHITCQDGVNIDLSGSAYQTAGMFELNWSGGSGNMVLTLPDATTTNNTHRAIRFISDSTYSTNTRTYLTPSSSQTLDGSTDFYEINKKYEGIMVWSDGIEWFRIQTKA